MAEKDDNEVIVVELPRWKVEKMEKMIEERQAYDVLTSKLKNWWVWAVAASVITVIYLWDTIKIKVGG